MCYTHAQVVLGKRVRLYHDLVIGLKARLEQETSAADGAKSSNKEQDLAELEKCLARRGGNNGTRTSSTTSSSGGGGGVGGAGEREESSSVGLDSTSMASDTASGAQVVWAGGACGALVYESVDELRVAVDSLQVYIM